MSAFLGPIHFWLYNKIQLQEDLTDHLVASLPEAQAAELRAALDEGCGAAERRPLEEVIDEGNIHGWLQAHVTVAEKRFAQAVTSLLAERSLDELAELARAHGRAHTLTAATAPEAFKALNDTLLDGMPCDRVNAPGEATDGRVTWTRTQDIHAEHWTALGADPAAYWTLRNAWVAGMIEEAPFALSIEGDTYTVTAA